jgi:hypothetical protein
MPFKLRQLLIPALISCVAAACTTSSPPPPAPVSPPAPPVEPSVDPSGAITSGGSGAGGGATAGTPAEKMCGGIAGVRCPEKQYCAYAPEARCGAADMSGTCTPIPELCTQQLDEVCGCNDKTYGNACAAAQAGVSVAMKGACAKHEATGIAEGKLCGTRGVNGECAAGLYCAYKADCGATDAGGTCSKKPTMCTKIYAPVCGCDGKTYGSACTAAAAGMSVAKKGECKP